MTEPTGTADGAAEGHTASSFGGVAEHQTASVVGFPDAIAADDPPGASPASQSPLSNPLADLPIPVAGPAPKGHGTASLSDGLPTAASMSTADAGPQGAAQSWPGQRSTPPPSSSSPPASTPSSPSWLGAAPSSCGGCDAAAIGSGGGQGGGGGAGDGRGPPGTLQELCAKLIQRNLSIYNCVELLSVLSEIDGPSLAVLRAASLRYAVNSFETLQTMRPEVELRAALTAEVYDSLAAAQRERAEAVAAMRRMGRVKERAAPKGPEAQGSDEPSIAGRPVSYPPAALGSGVAWPPDVDAGTREEWLSAADFGRLFGGLSWEEYTRLPGWKRERYKKEAGLF